VAAAGRRRASRNGAGARFLRVVVAAAMGVGSGCGGAPPEIDPADFLRVGVDMRAECRSVADTLARVGLEVSTRLERPRYCALGAASADGARSAVRILTARGIAYAADGRSDGLPGHTPVSLLAPPGGVVGPEVLVARAPSEASGRCIDVVHVDARGGARVVGIDLATLVVPDFVETPTCVADVLDADANGTAEAWIALRVPALAAAGGRVPTLRIPLAPGAAEFVYVAPAEAHWQRERAARVTALDEARAVRDLATAHALAVELALVARLVGQPPAAQRTAYDAGLAAWSRTPELDALTARVHEAFADE
jgi:hypothetical protein